MARRPGLSDTPTTEESMPSATVDTVDPVDIEVDTEDGAAGLPADDADTPELPKPHAPAPTRRAVVLIVAIVVALAGLVGWLGFRARQSQETQTQQNQFLQAAKQGAVNLTTIDWHHPEADVQRILDAATGQFYDDFAQRSKPFIDVVKQVQATTVGTITAAGLESQTRDTAQVLVAASVQTSDASAPTQVPRAWRMRVFVQKIDGRIKVSNVEFVS
ncbi:mammalian cell entry protein [Mycobacterium vulneris]|uniref:Mammalian cell entry protein n=2 Tax=Mycolicibacterium vulneris TaxID=547163 RepID=A0A1X2LE52_9MYCO|nr:mammalian cell entry protein [Mycolicibacterium vulneris]